MKNVCLIIGISLLLVFAGCGDGESEKDGAIGVSWAIGGTTCGAASVSIVEISVYDDSRVYNTATVACQLGQYEIGHIPVGTYNVRIDGIQSTSAVPIYEGTIDSVRVVADDTTQVPRIYLAEKPGGIDLTWKFDDGSLCSFAGVDVVTVNVWDTHANRVFNQDLACDPGKANEEAEAAKPIRSLYDTAKGIVIDGLFAGDYTVQAFAKDSTAGGVPKHFAEERDVTTIHGRLTPVDLTLTLCDGNAICL